jgi:hypothetical protein
MTNQPLPFERQNERIKIKKKKNVAHFTLAFLPVKSNVL